MGIEDDIPAGVGRGWDNYAPLVLHELRRISRGQEEMNQSFHESLQQQAVDRQAAQDFRTAVELKHTHYDETLYQPKYGLVPRVGQLEGVEQVHHAVVLDRKWLVAGGFGIVTALLIPAASFVAQLISALNH